jgi:hypothetical protein
MWVFRGFGLVPVAAFEAVGDDAAFDLFHDVEEAGVGLLLEQGGGVGVAAQLGREKVGGEGGAVGEDDAAFHGVFELADVAGPLVVHHEAEGFGGELGRGKAVFFGVELEVVGGEERDVFLAAAERWELEGDDVEAVEEVLAEAAFLDGLLEVDVGGGDDADVDLDLLVAADVHEAAVLKDAEDLGLHVHAHGADLVEEEGATVGYFEEAFLGGDGGGEGSALVAEEGGFEEFGGDGAGVDGDEGLVAARGVLVDGLGDELLAGAGLALDEDGGAAGGGLGDDVEEAEHAVALADDVFEGGALLEGFFEDDDLLLGGVLADGGADVGEEFFVVPGLLDEVGGSGADGVDDVVDRAVGGDHDDGQVGDEGLDAGQEIDAAFAGEGEVEEQEVVGVAGEEVEAGVAVGGEVDAEALEHEEGFEGFADAGFVVDDEDALAARVR